MPTESVEGQWPPPLEETVEEVVDEEEADLEELLEFDEKWKSDFEGLAYLGALQKTVRSIPYHKFVIRTLLPTEKLEVAMICKELEDTMGYARAYRGAIVAAGLLYADGQPLPVFDKKLSPIRERYSFIIESWYDPTIDTLYEEIDRLEARSNEIMKGLLTNPKF